MELRRLAVAFVFLFSLSSCAFGQRPADIPTPSPASASTDPGPTSISFFVTDKAGSPVTGLQQQDFTLQIDKKPQTINSFEEVTATKDPVEVILVVDSVNTRANNVAEAREQIGRYLTQNGGKLPHPTSIIYFSDKDTVFSPSPSQDGNALKAQLDKTGSNLRDVGRDAGLYGYMEELYKSIQAMNQIADYETSRPGRKLLLWISSGWRPLAGPEVQLSKKNEEDLFAMLVRTTTALRRAQITLTSIDPLGTRDAAGFRVFAYQSFLKGVAKPSQMQIANLLLEVLATDTGGLVMNSSNDVVKLINTAASDADSFYRITLTPPPPTHPNDYHEVKILVDKPKEIAHAITGYYADPEVVPSGAK